MKRDILVGIVVVIIVTIASQVILKYAELSARNPK